MTSPKTFNVHCLAFSPKICGSTSTGSASASCQKRTAAECWLSCSTSPKAQGWLHANQETAADALGTYKIKQRDVEIYTPAELSKLLNAADADFLPYLALIAFGGVRREELHKGLTWDAINFDRATITVPASIAKTARKRKIVMSENLLEWLAPYRVKSGPIFDIDPRKRIAKVVKASGVKWKRNALRHSFGSYRMEQTKNEGLVALEMGNSPKVVKDHYFEIVDEHDAKAYWSIKPLPKARPQDRCYCLMVAAHAEQKTQTADARGKETQSQSRPRER